MRRSELLQMLATIPGFPTPRADREQVVTPAEAAASLLASAERWEGLDGRSVLDLGCGTGRLAIGAALLGASPVHGFDNDPEAIEVARSAARSLGVDVSWEVGDVHNATTSAAVVITNPPFGAQRRHADRPFWDAAWRLAERSAYGFALAESRTFIARRAVARGAHVLEIDPVPWVLPRTFAHHTRSRVDLKVDLWAFRTSSPT